MEDNVEHEEKARNLESWREELGSILRNINYDLLGPMEEPILETHRRSEHQMEEPAFKNTALSVPLDAFENTIEHITMDAHKRASLQEKTLMNLKRQIHGFAEEQGNFHVYMESVQQTLNRLYGTVNVVEDANRKHYNAILEIQNALHGLERWKTKAESTVAGLISDTKAHDKQYAALQLASHTQISREEFQSHVNSVVSAMSEDIMARLREHDKALASATANASLAYATIKELKALQENSHRGGAAMIDKEAWKPEFEEMFRSRDALLEAKLGERIANLDKEIAWKLMQESNTADLRIRECRSELLRILQDGQLLHTRQQQASCPGESGSMEKSKTVLAALESEMHTLKVKLEETRDRTPASESIATKSDLRTAIDKALLDSRSHDDVKMEIKQIVDQELKLFKENWVQEINAQQVKTTAEIAKIKQEMAFLRAESKSLRDQNHDLSTTLEHYRSLETQHLDNLRALSTRQCESESTIENLRTQLQNTKRSDDVLKSSLEETIQASLDKGLRRTETKMENLMERLERLERSAASVQTIHVQAENELREAMLRTANKLSPKTNSAGSTPEPVITSSASQANNVKRRYSMSSVPEARKTDSEQSEREAKRQAELAAVRKRLEEFEKKWRENELQKKSPSNIATSTHSRKPPLKIAPPPPPPDAKQPPKAGPMGSDDQSPEREEQKTWEQALQEAAKRQEQFEDDEAAKDKSPPPNTRTPMAGKQGPGTVACKYCSRLLPGKRTAAFHEEVCERRPVTCDSCGQSFSRTDLKAHQGKCIEAKRDTEEQQQVDEMVSCKYCDDEFPMKSISSHEVDCDWVPRKCCHCGMVIIARDLSKHEARCPSSPSQTSSPAMAIKQLGNGGPRKSESEVEKWDPVRVVQWVRNQVPACAQAFEDLNVDGSMLIEISEEDLENDLKITNPAHRKRILDALQRLLA